jgi:hypothetical protein
MKAEEAQAESRLQMESVVAARTRAEDVAKELQSAVEQLRRASGSATGQASRTAREIERLANNLADVGPAQASTTARIGPRVYIHIADEKYRPAAIAFERRLEDASVDGSRVVVPGIELVRTSLPRSVLRCFRAQECAEEGPRLVEAVNMLLAQPQVRLQDLSATYGRSSSIRPRHYEIWFTAGDITLRR